MRFFGSFALAGLALLELVAGAAISTERRSVQEPEKRGVLAMAQPRILKPIKRSLHRRDDLSALDPRAEESFLYGDPDDGEQSPFAHMKIVMDDGRQLVSMERFEGLTKSVKCGEKMELDFVSKEAFEYAIKAWNWVNENDDKTFVMIANHEGCGEAFERTPYRVYDVDYDEKTFIAYLFSKKVAWTEIKGEMTLDFGSLQDVPLDPDYLEAKSTPGQGITKRGFGDISGEKSITVDMEKSLGASKTVVATNVKGVDVSLDCLNCGTKGQFEISGRIVANLFGFDLKELSVQAKPKGFSARLELELEAAGVLKDYNEEKKLVEIALPGSIAIPKLFKLGASLDYSVGMSASIDGKATISYGTEARLSDDAIVKVDIKNPSNSQFSGWQPSFETIPMKASAEITGDFAVYSKPALSLGFDVLDKWGYEAALEMKLPELATTLKVKADKNGGLCGSKDNKVAIDAGASVAVDLTFRVGEANNGQDFYSKQLFQVKKDLFSKCFGFHGSSTGDGTNGGGNGGNKTKKTEAPKETKKAVSTKKAVPKTQTKDNKPPSSTKKPPSSTKKPPSSTKKPSSSTKKADPKSPAPTPKTTPKSSQKSNSVNSTKKANDKNITATPRVTSKPAEESGSSQKADGKSSSSRANNNDKSKSSQKNDAPKSSASEKDDPKQTPVSKSENSSKEASSSKKSDPAASSATPHGTQSVPSVSAKPSVSSVKATPSKTASSSAAPSSSDSPDACALYYPSPSGKAIKLPRGMIRRDCTKRIVCDGTDNNLSNDDLPSNNNNSGKDSIKFECVDDGGAKQTFNIQYYNYPSPGNAANNKDMIEKYYDYSTTSCEDWTVTKIATPRTNAKYQTEHVYEAQMVRDYLQFLRTKADKKPTCAQLKTMFLDGDWKSSGVHNLVRHIANSQLESSLYAAAILEGGLNRQKAALWTTDKLIADSKLTTPKPQDMFKRIKQIGGAMSYMQQPRIKQMMGCTIKAINNELSAMEKSAAFKTANLDGFSLKESHQKYIEWAYGNANTRSSEIIKKVANTMIAKNVVKDMHPEDKKYVEQIAAGKKTIPALDVPTEDDAANCGTIPAAAAA